MKIKPEHYAIMRERIAAIYVNVPSVSYYETLPHVKDAAKRRRWDASYLAKLSTFFNLEVYRYANDEHIDTALRAVLAELDGAPKDVKVRTATNLAVTLVGLLSLTGCAVMPDRARVELSHDSHATAGRTGCHTQCAEDGLSRASLILKWQHGPLTIEAGEGWNLRGRNGGGFYGPGEVFTGRIGYEFNLKGR